MTGVLTLLRASVLGALLCIGASQLGHVQRWSATELQQNVEAEQRATLHFQHDRGHARLTTVAQWIAHAQRAVPLETLPDSRHGGPSDSQTFGGSFDTEGDDVDDFDDALLHHHVTLFCLDFGASSHDRGLHRQSVRARREDRRCDKPPRPRVV